MSFDPEKHHRRSIRLKGYDYTLPGAYFVTLVTWQRKNLFGDISNSSMQLNEIGKIVESCWLRLPAHFTTCLDEWAIMPNHFLGIVLIKPGTGEASAQKEPGASEFPTADASPQRPNGTQPGSLGAIIQNFKSITSRKIHELYGRRIRQASTFTQVERVGGFFAPTRIWQRNYFERIIRNDAEWELIREYISVNPLHWAEDQFNG